MSNGASTIPTKSIASPIGTVKYQSEVPARTSGARDQSSNYTLRHSRGDGAWFESHEVERVGEQISIASGAARLQVLGTPVCYDQHQDYPPNFSEESCQSSSAFGTLCLGPRVPGASAWLRPSFSRFLEARLEKQMVMNWAARMNTRESRLRGNAAGVVILTICGMLGGLGLGLAWSWLEGTTRSGGSAGCHGWVFRHGLWARAGDLARGTRARQLPIGEQDDGLHRRGGRGRLGDHVARASDELIPPSRLQIWE